MVKRRTSNVLPRWRQCRPDRHRPSLLRRTPTPYHRHLQVLATHAHPDASTIAAALRDTLSAPTRASGDDARQDRLYLQQIRRACGRCWDGSGVREERVFPPGRDNFSRRCNSQTRGIGLIVTRVRKGEIHRAAQPFRSPSIDQAGCVIRRHLRPTQANADTTAATTSTIECCALVTTSIAPTRTAGEVIRE